MQKGILDKHQNIEGETNREDIFAADDIHRALRFQQFSDYRDGKL